MQPGRRALVGVGVLLLWCCGACTTARRELSPQDTLKTFASALERGDLPRAYGMLSKDLRAHLSMADFQKLIAENRAEAQALVSSLKGRTTVRTYARAELATGGEVMLARRGDRYEIDTPVFDFYPQDTPREALESFIRAVEQSRWDILLRLMPEADRQGLDAEALGKNLEAQEEELTRMVALLKASRNAPIEVVGDRATMPYGESYTARFVRENERWAIEDPE